MLLVDDIDNFSLVRDFPADSISPDVIETVRDLDERRELEPFLRDILTDPDETPHGPAEIADILTQHVTIRGQRGLAAFVLKGKSFSTVRPAHVSHQIYRLEKIDDLSVGILAASGIILDAVKEQFSGTLARMGCDYAILDAGDLARLFVAYGFLCPRDGGKIRVGRCGCGYSPEHRFLNLLQEEALKELAVAHGLGQRAGLVVLPPGSGKTRVAAEDSKRQEAKQILFVAHTHEILDVAESEFTAIHGAGSVNRVSEVDTKTFDKVNLITIQLAHRHADVLSRTPFDYVIVDEFHHAAAKTYRKLLDSISPNFLLGLTATPFRADRKDIVQLCDGNVVVEFDLRYGIETGILVPYHYRGVFDNIDYTNIKHNGTQYDIRDLERSLVIPERDSGIIEKWRELAEDKPTLAFCCSHEHAQRFSESLNTQGVSADVYLSSTPTERRRELFEVHRNGDVKVLCVVDVLNEGADFPHVDCLLFLRPTESKRIFVQQLGRGLRRFTGKSHCVVIDFIGNFKNACKIPEYLGLGSEEEDFAATRFSRSWSAREILNLPLGCRVDFEDKVIDVFASQVLSPRYATRHNIGRILVYQYKKLARRLQKVPTKLEVRRGCLLHDGLYKDVFGSWKNFEQQVPDILGEEPDLAELLKTA